MVIHVVYQLCKLNFDYFIFQLNTNKSHVVGCHIGLSPSYTDRNRSSILFDCCVNDFLPLLCRMGSYTANIVVLRRVSEVPTLWERTISCCQYSSSIAKQHHKPQLQTPLNGLLIVVLSKALEKGPSIPKYVKNHLIFDAPK